ncbi:MAG: deoxyribodipyrimidine photo-lyase [Alphaproteobacteria bacterium]|nr:deoxyribodipyrimidine photo-lyase [Alphaproteobacteria bacterium]
MASGEKETVIVWFRQDLRLSDNPALHYAHQTGANIVPVFILDDDNAQEWKRGGASRVWLHHALKSLSASLSNNLVVKSGSPEDILKNLAQTHKATTIFWNRCYEPWRIKRDTHLKTALEETGINTKRYNGCLLWEPWAIKKKDGTPYKVFTPFYKKGCLNAEQPRAPLPAPNDINFANNLSGHNVEALNLLPEKTWATDVIQHWDISEAGAKKRLYDFLSDGLHNYKEGRNHPSQNNVSRLSPYLHFGMISPNECWYAALEKGSIENWEKDRDHFLSELGWREFSYHLLFHFPHITWDNLNPKFNNFPWSDEPSDELKRWQKGLTGYPIVDAGMRELWQTGYMHNRVRMIVGSFLVKNMMTHWHQGEQWFWDTLFDADLANNSASWQWIAGCGADAAPYFRIFNPILQSQKFDPDGEYIKKYVPELKDLDAKHIHAPWDAPPLILAEAGITLGKEYPEPMMDHSKARDRALEAFQTTKT